MRTYLLYSCYIFQLFPLLVSRGLGPSLLSFSFLQHDEKNNGLIKKKCSALLEALKGMPLVKASGGGEKTMHCFPK